MEVYVADLHSLVFNFYGVIFLYVVKRCWSTARTLLPKWPVYQLCTTARYCGSTAETTWAMRAFSSARLKRKVYCFSFHTSRATLIWASVIWAPVPLSGRSKGLRWLARQMVGLTDWHTGQRWVKTKMLILTTTKNWRDLTCIWFEFVHQHLQQSKIWWSRDLFECFVLEVDFTNIKYSSVSHCGWLLEFINKLC